MLGLFESGRFTQVLLYISHDCDNIRIVEIYFS